MPFRLTWGVGGGGGGGGGVLRRRWDAALKKDDLSCSSASGAPSVLASLFCTSEAPSGLRLQWGKELFSDTKHNHL